MINKISKLSKILIYLFLFLGWILVIVRMGENNLSNPNFWYDETGQFWMAKGLNHFSPPLQKEGNVAAVIRENNNFNLDPGGFTILLHFWSKISNSPFWLRLLPYLFFIGSCVVLAFVVYEISKIKWLSLLALWFFPLIKGEVFYYGFELRAYSMEYFGVLLSIYLLLKYFSKKSWRSLLLLNIVLAIFISSRYSFIICAFVISTISFIVGIRVSLKKLMLYIPIFVSLIVTYLISYRWQFHHLISPEYTKNFMIKYLNYDQVVSLLTNNLISPKSIAITAIMALSVYLFFYSISTQKIYRKIFIIGTFSTLYNVSFAILSTLGIHTWNVGVRWNLPFQAINILCIASLLSLFLYKVTLKKCTNKSKLFSILISTLLLLMSKQIIRRINLTKLNIRVVSDSVYSNIKALNIDEEKQYYIAFEDAPTWRYLNEYGPLSGNHHYPQNTIFGQPKDDMSVYLNSDYIIQSSSANIDFSQDLSRGYVSDITIYKPSHVYMVNKR